MKITKIKMELTYTKNTGNYENYKPTVMIEADVDGKDDVQSCLDELRELCQKEIRTQIGNLKEG